MDDPDAREREEGQMVLGLFLPADQESSASIEPAQRSFHDPAARLPLPISFHPSRFLPDRSDVRSELEVPRDLSTEGKVVPLVQAEILRSHRGNNTRASNVGSSSLESWRLAGAIAAASGIPSASVRMLRLTPRCPRSVGLGPVAGPPRGTLYIPPSRDCQRHARPTSESYVRRASRHASPKTPAARHSWNRSWTVLGAPMHRGRDFH